MISEDKKNEIEKGAREILKNFSKSLAKVKLSEKKKNHEGVGGFRKENTGEKCDEYFREMMFKNAPNKNDRCIIAEKKEW
ncbi:MAG: hypothetical protein Q7R87_01770 [Nanoarchaeota archaeon]|nr:hypothetical protein [Nanoarchaeota archaeon]